jgi:hypothetical protein
MLKQIDGAIEIVFDDLAAATLPVTPARTLGLAAASMIQPTSGKS